MMQNNALSRAVEIAGSQAKLARHLGVTQQAISGWLLSGVVPVRRVLAICDISGVPPHELRPDIYRPPASP